MAGRTVKKENIQKIHTHINDSLEKAERWKLVVKKCCLC
jgi:hypothetical protein